jgi:FkbM family methyltransferase
MNVTVQKGLIALYATIRRTGMLETRPGRMAFLWAYRFYKHHFEAGPIDGLKRFVSTGGTIIDVGANVGVFSELFAGWVGSNGRVMAIEPEANNLRSLASTASALGSKTPIDVIAGAASDRSGSGRLAVNRDHPGDHRLSDAFGPDTLSVALYRLDDLMAERDWPPVQIIKVDVQGAELQVINGATDILRRDRPAVFMEIDDNALRTQGTSASELVKRMDSLHYRPHALDADGAITPIDADAIIARVSGAQAYVDILFLAESDGVVTL